MDFGFVHLLLEAEDAVSLVDLGLLLDLLLALEALLFEDFSAVEFSVDHFLWNKGEGLPSYCSSS